MQGSACGSNTAAYARDESVSSPTPKSRAATRRRPRPPLGCCACGGGGAITSTPKGARRRLRRRSAAAAAAASASIYIGARERSDEVSEVMFCTDWLKSVSFHFYLAIIDYPPPGALFPLHPRAHPPHTRLGDYPSFAPIRLRRLRSPQKKSPSNPHQRPHCRGNPPSPPHHHRARP